MNTIRYTLLVILIFGVIGSQAGFAEDKGEPAIKGKTLGQWTAALNDSDSKARTAAATALGELGAKGQGAIPALAATAKDTNTDARRAAIAALGKIGGKDGLAALVELTQGIKRQRVAPDMGAFAAALGAVGKDAVPELRALLKEDDVRVRLVSVSAMSQIGKDALKGLGEALDDADAKVRLSAVQGLGRVGADAAELLIRALGDEQCAVREDAMQRLGKALKDAKAPLVTALKSEKAVIRAYAASLLAGLGANAVDAVKPLAENLTHDDLNVRFYAAVALAAIGPKATDAVKPLCGAVKDKNPSVQRQAIRALAAIAPKAKETVAALAGAVTDPDVNVRTAAVNALGKTGATGSEAVGALLELLKAEKPTVAPSTVLETLQGIGPENAKVETKVLVDALSVKNADVRVFVCNALATRGPDAKAAVASLLPLLTDSKKEVREAAYAALKKIDPEAAKKAVQPR